MAFFFLTVKVASRYNLQPLYTPVYALWHTRVSIAISKMVTGKALTKHIVEVLMLRDGEKKEKKC